MDDKKTCSSCQSLRFFDAIKAGFMATLILTIVMGLFGTNSLKGLGELLIGGEASFIMIYLAGALLHFAIGIFYGLIYAIVFAPIGMFNGLIRAIVFSILITAVSLYASPKLPEAIGTVKNEVLHMDSNESTKSAHNPCQLSAPSNPCAQKITKDMLVKTWVNHFIFALVLGVLYRRSKM